MNGSPAYRCVYTIKSPGKVIVLRVFKKTTNGPARKDLEVVKQRLKNLKI
ncbi:type II toxin-antitoxin system RelE/ParE family toxin [Klebsiella quasipneumoniae subsp. similipneumoniae]